MCLAIYKPATTLPDWDAYQSGHTSNDHSWGFSAVVDGRLVTCCGVGEFAEFREAFAPYADKQAIIHFRWATHGSKTHANCHPFLVSDDLAVIHNGVISINCNVHSDRSDTWHFNELVLRPMLSRDADFYSRADVIYTMEMAHRGNKFVFLRADGDFSIWNADDGKWETDGHWYSNSDYKGYRMGYGYASQSKPAASTRTERSWVEVDEGRYRYSEDRDIGLASAILEDTDEYDDMEEYTDMRVHDLRMYGFSSKTINEVMELTGHIGIEALHDAI
jgi:glutamine amidotransferase